MNADERQIKRLKKRLKETKSKLRAEKKHRISLEEELENTLNALSQYMGEEDIDYTDFETWSLNGGCGSCPFDQECNTCPHKEFVRQELLNEGNDPNAHGIKHEFLR